VVALFPANVMNGLRLALIAGDHQGRPYIKQPECKIMRARCRASLIALSVPVAMLLGSVMLHEALGQPSGADRGALSRQAFMDISTVLKHPRCLNCHTSVDYPRQGDDQHRHLFNVKRGSDDRGATALRCQTCHQADNHEASGVPGAPGWRLAPLRMAWDGLSPGQLCKALLDPARGGMTAQTLIEHLQTEKLVAWAWHPGRNPRGDMRRQPPISHEQLLALARDWAELGAACP
jgi:hypothetical protein